MSNKSFNNICTQVASVTEVIEGNPCLQGIGIQGYHFEKHAECGERLARNKQSQGSVCLGFLRGDSSSQSLSNGNQLTANKAIAWQRLFAFVVDLWVGLLFIVLYSLKLLKGRQEKFILG